MFHLRGRVRSCLICLTAAHLLGDKSQASPLLYCQSLPSLCEVCSVHYSVHSAHYAGCSMQCAGCGVQGAECSGQCAVCNVQFAVYSVQCTVYIEYLHSP